MGPQGEENGRGRGGGGHTGSERGDGGWGFVDRRISAEREREQRRTGRKGEGDRLLACDQKMFIVQIDVFVLRIGDG